MGGLVNAIMVTASRLGYIKLRLRSPLVIPCSVVTVGNQSATTWTFNSLTKAKNRLTRGKPTKCCALLGYTIGGGTVMIPSYSCCNMKTTHVTKRYGLNSGHPDRTGKIRGGQFPPTVSTRLEGAVSGDEILAVVLTPTAVPAGPRLR